MGFIDEKQTVSLTEKPVKPRRTKGTAAHRARNRFAQAVIAGSALIGAIYMILPTTSHMKEALKASLFTQSAELGSRARSMSFVGEKKSSVDIEKLLAELGNNTTAGSDEPKQ